MNGRNNLKSITVLTILLVSTFCTSIHAVGRPGMSDRGAMPIPANIAKDFEALQTETLEQSIKNLYLVDFYYWPRSRSSGAGGITLPLPESEGIVDVYRIFGNMRFIKVYNEISQINNIRASKLITDEINETLPLYLRMFSESWDKVFKAHENESPEQRQTVGPSLQVSDDPNGTPTLAGVRYKLLSLVALAGNLKLESTKPAIAKVVTEALAQREKFYDPNMGFSGDRFSMLTKAGIYNRQVLATGILLTSETQTKENSNSTDEIEERWEIMEPMRFYNLVGLPADLVRPDYTQDSKSAKIHKPLDDDEFDKICQDENIVQEDNIKIIPVPSQNVLTLDTGDIEQILQRIGFTNEQIEKHSFSIRDGISKSGAVRITINDEIDAGLAVMGDEVFISTRSKGQFIYNIKTGWTNTPRLR